MDAAELTKQHLLLHAHVVVPKAAVGKTNLSEICLHLC